MHGEPLWMHGRPLRSQSREGGQRAQIEGRPPGLGCGVLVGFRGGKSAIGEGDESVSRAMQRSRIQEQGWRRLLSRSPPKTWAT